MKNLLILSRNKVSMHGSNRFEEKLVNDGNVLAMSVLYGIITVRLASDPDASDSTFGSNPNCLATLTAAQQVKIGDSNHCSIQGTKNQVPCTEVI